VGCITPVGEYLSLDALPWVLYVLAEWSGDDEQGADGARRLQRQGRSGAPFVAIFLEELHASSSRALQQCHGKKAGCIYKSRHASKILHASELTMQSTQLRCGSRSLHDFVKHVAKSALLHAKTGYLTRKMMLLHQNLSHSTLCCNLKQLRALTHMFSVDSDLVMRGSARMSALAPRYLKDA
jgi:hypothetical protein